MGRKEGKEGEGETGRRIEEKRYGKCVMYSYKDCYKDDYDDDDDDDDDATVFVERLKV